jgi:hypothetical protein
VNKLSLLLYIADVTEKLSSYLWTFGLLVLLSYVGLNVAQAVSTATFNEERGSSVSQYRTHGLIRNKLIVVGVVLIMISSVIPSRQTMYLIAASEIGETVILSPEMTETVGKMKAVIDKKLEEFIEDEPEATAVPQKTGTDA